MINIPSRKIVNQLKNEYPAGTLGTVKGVDDMGSIMVHWDKDSSLSLVYGVDSCRKV